MFYNSRKTIWALSLFPLCSPFYCDNNRSAHSDVHCKNFLPVKLGLENFVRRCGSFTVMLEARSLYSGNAYITSRWDF